MNPLSQAVSPAIGVVGQRVIKMPGVSMDDPLAHEDGMPFGDIKPADLAIFRGFTPEEPDSGIEPKCFSDNIFGVGELR